MFQFGKQTTQLIEAEENEDDTYDDNLSQGDVLVLGGASEYNDG